MENTIDIEKTIPLDREEANKRKGWVATTIFHLFILFLLLWKFASYPDPPPGQEGILVSFGEQYIGEGEEQPQGEADGEMTDAPSEPTETAETAPAAEPIAEAQPAAPPEAAPPSREVVTSEDPDQIAAQKAKDEARQKRREARKEAEGAKKEADAEAQEKANAEAKKKAADAKKKAAAEAKKRAAEEAARKEQEAFEEAKKEFANMFKGNGSQGNAGKPGDAGTKDGDPDAKNLEGTQSPGKGDKDVGGDLAGRGVAFRPTVDENSQETGSVRIKVCVDKNGAVTKTDYTMTGSNTQSSVLVQKAIEAAKKYRFEAGNSLEQCGHITFHFKVQ